MTCTHQVLALVAFAACVGASACGPAPQYRPPTGDDLIGMPPPSHQRIAPSNSGTAVTVTPHEVRPPAPEATPRLSPPELKIDRKRRGLTVATVTRSDTALAHLVLVVHAGGHQARPGVAQLTAGLIAQGAAAPPQRGGLTARLADLGATLRVDTLGDYTSFRVTVMAHRASDAVDLLGTMLSAPQPRAKQFDALRSRLIAEARARRRGSDAWLAHELLGRSLWGGSADSRYAVAGTAFELGRDRHAHCAQFYREHYRSGGLTLVAVGAAQHESIVAAAASAFAEPREPRAAQQPQHEGSAHVIYLIDRPSADAARVFWGRSLAPANPQSPLAHALRAAASNAKLLTTHGGPTVLVEQRIVPIAELSSTLANAPPPPNVQTRQRARWKVRANLANRLRVPAELAAHIADGFGLGLPDDHAAHELRALHADEEDGGVLATGGKNAVVLLADRKRVLAALRGRAVVVVDPARSFAINGRKGAAASE